MFYFIKGLARKKYGTPTGYSHSTGGDMQGSLNTVSVWTESDGDITVTFASKKRHDLPLSVAEYSVDPFLLDGIGKLIDEYRIYRFPGLPKKRVLALDAAWSSWYFAFASGDNYSFADQLAISKKGYEGLEKIDALIRASVYVGEKLPRLILPDAPDTPEKRYTDGEVTLSVTEYMMNCLTYRIANGLDEDAVTDGDIRLFAADGTELYSYESRYPITINPKNFEEDDIELKCPRLGAGTYRLTVGSLCTEFKIK